MELARDWDAGPYRPVSKDSREVNPEIIPISRRASVPRAAPTALAMRLQTPIAMRHSSTWGPKSTPTTEAMKAKATSRQTNTHTQEAASVAVRTFQRARPARVCLAPTGETAMIPFTATIATVVPMPQAKASSAK